MILAPLPSLSPRPPRWGPTPPLSPHAATLRAHAASRLGEELRATYGACPTAAWHLEVGRQWALGSEVLAPDVCGWRRARRSRPVPDWVGEVLSHPDEREGLLSFYAHEGVRHVWLVEPEARSLQVLALDGARYTLLALHFEEQTVRAEPFGALELPLRLLWTE